MKKAAPLHAHFMAKGADIAPRVIRFIGSDESLDRDGDTISVGGWDTSAYMRNPVVLYGHDYYSLPVAKTIACVVDQYMKALLFDVYFPTIEELATDPAIPSEHALRVDAIYNMAKAGLLNTVSVGFRGIEFENTSTGRAYKKQELMELSIVPVPANPNAVAVARAVGIDETVLKGVFAVEKSGRRLSAKSKAFVETMQAEIRGCHERLKACDAALAAFVAEDDEPVEEDGAVPPVKEAESGVKPEKAYFVLVEKDSARPRERE